MIYKRVVRVGIVTAVAVLGSCSQAPSNKVGTPEMRAALFDTIMARTERRAAWSPIKNETLGFDPVQAMLALREEVVSAETEESLYYAIAKLSHARRDRHLDLSLVPGGLELADSAGLNVLGADDPDAGQAPVRVFPNYALDGPEYFVGDLAPGADGGALPQVGDRVTAVNGIPIALWESEATAFTRHSTVIGLKWKIAEMMTTGTASYPPSMRADGISLTVRSGDGEERTFRLKVHPTESLVWQGTGEPTYDGLELVHETVTYDLFVDDARRVVVLVWTGFRETMIEDVDDLMEIAQERGLLDYAMIVDVTRSGGGSRGAYAVQRLQGKPFKTTFGNLRISDVTKPFVEDRRAAFARRELTDGGVPETMDDGTWLMEWLEEDVLPALERGDAYTNNVPFKSAHAPKDSDGVLEPASVHFLGPFAVISGPSGGSHLDQFIHQVVDNDLGPVVGMPPGGYSNTWEWEEVLTFPGTDQPVVAFMWNIGHTITPGGEIAEGNPAEIDEWIPLSADNVENYYAMLLEAALRHLGVTKR
ncbi:MAG: hypothetical protein IH968_06970 [Gemmatimonadetes bacterium]|nr:hypothetical protein [Gemmatimonadota bacterium]